MIILDTNVVSEMMKPDCAEAVRRWADRQARQVLWTTVTTIIETRSGILMLPQGRRRETLNVRFSIFLQDAIENRVLPLDTDAAERASEVFVLQRRSGRDIGIRDVEIAGIALSRNALLATRNTRDFERLGLRLIDPWTD